MLVIIGVRRFSVCLSEAVGVSEVADVQLDTEEWELVGLLIEIDLGRRTSSKGLGGQTGFNFFDRCPPLSDLLESRRHRPHHHHWSRPSCSEL